MHPGDGHQSMPGKHQVTAPSTALSRGSFLLLNQLFSSYSNNMVGHTGFVTSHLNPLPSLHGG